MSVRTRLIASFAAVALLLLLPNLFAASRLAELRHLAVGRRVGQASAALAVGRLQARLAEFDRYERSYVATAGPGLRTSAERTAALMQQEMDSLRASPYARPAAIVQPVLDSIAVASATIRADMDSGNIKRATDGFGKLDPLFSEGQDRLRALADSIDAIAQEDFQRAEDISASARRDTLGGVVVVLLVSVLLATWTTDALTRPLRRLAGAMAAVAGGHLSAPEDLPYAHADEIGALSRSFRAMTRRLADLDRMKAEFVGVASHELKTPINVINGYAELIEEDLQGALTDHQSQILHGIAEQAAVMSRLVSRLMDISRLEAGTYRLEFEPLHVADLITGVVRRFDVLARGKGVSLTSEIADSAPQQAVLDIDIIRDEVLGNLVANALRFAGEGGWVRLSVSGDADRLMFRVSDSGPGIPVDHRPHIFDKYYQVHRSRAVGAGLGLAIAREMVEMHHGSISLEPAVEGVGAAFLVTLPREQPAEPSPAPAVAGSAMALS
jgi:signal transduction histidine kinase